MKRPHGGLTYLEIRQFELDFFEIRYRLLFDSKNLHLLVDHTLPECGVFRLCGNTQVRTLTEL